MTTEYLSEVIRRLNDQAIGYGEVRDHYSFEQALEDGLTAKQAVEECLSWLELD